MAQAIANPDDIENFANHLRRFCDNLNDETNTLNSAFRALNDTWDDPKYQEFEEILRQLESFLQRFNNEADEQEMWLRRKVSEIRTYLGR